MKRPKRRPAPNYVRKLNFLIKAGALPVGVGLHQVSVFHDPWCGVFRQRRCDCDPDIRLNWSQSPASRN